MSRHQKWAPYVPVATRRRQAALAVEKMRKKGDPVAPVVITGRTIANTFWGKAWCENLESYQDYENRLPRGRSYVRNGSVVDLQIAPKVIRAMVSGSSVYRVEITIAPLPRAVWQSLCADCSSGIDSLVELLQGRFAKGVMERLCRQDQGLFPRPKEIKFSCSCPDHAFMCKHVAAVLYGVGSRLDERPELLFLLRDVDHNDMVARVNRALPMGGQGPAADKLLDTDDVSRLFGLEMAEGTATDPKDPTTPKVRPPKAPPKQKEDPWSDIEQLIATCTLSGYVQATTKLHQLRQQAQKSRTTKTFTRLLAELRLRHKRKSRLIRQLDAVGLY
ncbi:MAG: SWIM zinc finger family protein [Magnetococcus sp. THC-1_WYH]